MPQYPVIDKVKTGKQLKQLIKNKGYTIKDIQQYLSLSCIDVYKRQENTNVEIEGMKGHYQNVTPEDIGIADTWNGVSIRPHTSSLKISASSV